MDQAKALTLPCACHVLQIIYSPAKVESALKGTLRGGGGTMNKQRQNFLSL
jgi:hypothetical protein